MTVNPLAVMPHATSDYGPRIHPITRKTAFHYGVDLPAATGTVIYAVADGIIAESRKSTAPGGGYGQYVLIRHAGNVETLYAHMVDGSRKVAAGDRITAGTPIGKVGQTGAADGPHIHFEVRVNKNPIQPLPWLKKQGATSPKPRTAPVAKAPTAPTVAPAAPAKAPAKAPAAKVAYITITVKAGDTVSALARKHKTTVAAITKWNKLKNASVIAVGQRLIVGVK